jgi:putative ABC transport system permease protein
MVSIAREILLHDKVRFVITVVSLGFAIVMIVYDLGMFFGTINESVNLIDHAGADLWILEEQHEDIFSPSLLPKSALKWARRSAGVREACALNTLMGNLTLDDTHQVQIVGIDPRCPLIQPWDLVAGDVAALRRKDTIVVDDFILRRDAAQVGDEIELNGRELRIVGITHYNKGFTTPYVYINLRTYTTIGGAPEHHTFVAMRLEPDADRGRIVRRLMNTGLKIRVEETQVLRLSSMQALIAQGVGMIFAVISVGVLVGMLIITLTIYTATVEQLRNFAILKALGASRWKIWGIVLEQAISQTTVSFGIGLAASLGLNCFVETVSGIRAQFPIPAVAGSLVVMILLAVVGSLLSIRRAVTVDPQMVFRA